MRKNGVITGHYHDHANIVRIVQGLPVRSKRTLQKQLERLRFVNDYYTLPYAKDPYERAREIAKITMRHH